MKRQTIQFWNWFRSIADNLASNPEDPVLIQGLDDRIRDLDPELSWEIGPGSSQPWQLVISPNLNRKLREKTQQIVSLQPNISGWEFHPSRQPKDWNYKLELVGSQGEQPLRLDALGWTFVLLRYPDGVHEIVLTGTDLPSLTDEQRWQAAAITLESILGEDLLLDRVDRFELVEKLEPRLASRERPIHQLRTAVLGIRLQ